MPSVSLRTLGSDVTKMHEFEAIVYFYLDGPNLFVLVLFVQKHRISVVVVYLLYFCIFFVLDQLYYLILLKTPILLIFPHYFAFLVDFF